MASMDIRRFVFLNLMLLTALMGSAVWSNDARGQSEEEYPIPADAVEKEGVPKGQILGPYELPSEVFPGTQRQYWLYVPAQYDKSKPACTLVVQDGLNRAKGWRLPTVCDNLIHQGEMPVTIGIFVNPGIVEAVKSDSQPRFNRSYEYDSLGDRYARFLLEELLPEVGKSYSLSTNPNDRALAGASSGGICAFNAAWERPDAFRRVLSTIGTYVGLRGANQLAALVRKVEPKPLRIFLQDGSSDLNIYAGDWWTANQDMLSSLEWAGYDVEHVWGEGGHNSKHAAAIMPDALKWLWQDYPEPVYAGPKANSSRRVNLLIDGADWEEVSTGHDSAESAAANAGGELFFSDSKAERIYRVGEDGKTRIFSDQTGRIGALAFSPDGQLYAVKDGEEIVRFGADGTQSSVADGIQPSCLLTLPDGFYYFDARASGVVWSDYQGNRGIALKTAAPVSALAVTSDQAFVHIVGLGRWVDHAVVGEQHKLLHRQEYGFLEMPYAAATNRASGAVVDQDSRLYVASPIGIQVFDQLGRVNFIIRPPSREPITGIAFGGGARDQLFVTTASSVYRRKLNTRGMATFGQPTKPPKPRL
ncbi:MAG: alpha/beta hydrolase-fold protein [Aureliella sp.]